MLNNAKYTANLGFVATDRAKPKNIDTQVLNLSSVTGKDIMHIKGTATVFDTLRLIEKIIKRDYHLLDPLAKKLQTQDLNQTLSNNWNWLYSHIDYKLDTTGTEQVRTPLRLVNDAYGDCDCFTTFIGALLREQNINFAIRMAKYQGDWQHVYIVVAKDQKNPSYGKNQYYTLDCVLNQYNQEQPFTDKHDVLMNLTELSGVPNQVSNLEKIKQQITHIAYNSKGNAMLQHKAKGILAIWDKPNARKKLLIEFNSAYNSGLGKTIFGKILSAPKKVVDKIGGTKIGGAISDVKDKILDSKVGKAIVRFNPVTTLARNGYLVMLQENIGQQAVKLGWGIVSRDNFLKYSDDVDYHNKSIESLKKVENMFIDMGGTKSSLHANIKEGFNKALKNGKVDKRVSKLEGLGEPIVTASLIAAGTAVFASAASLIDKKLSQDFALKSQVALQTATNTEKARELLFAQQQAQQQTVAPTEEKKSNTALYVGLGVGSLVLTGGLAYAISRKNNSNKRNLVATNQLSGNNHTAKPKKHTPKKTKLKSKTITI